jgi:hypothetical protein
MTIRRYMVPKYFNTAQHRMLRIKEHNMAHNKINTGQHNAGKVSTAHHSPSIKHQPIRNESLEIGGPMRLRL